MIKLKDEPKAVPIPRNAAIIDEAISLSRLCTALQTKFKLLINKNYQKRKNVNGLVIVLFKKVSWTEFEMKNGEYLKTAYFGAQIMARLAKYPLEKAKKHIKMMNM